MIDDDTKELLAILILGVVGAVIITGLIFASIYIPFFWIVWIVVGAIALMWAVKFLFFSGRNNYFL